MKKYVRFSILFAIVLFAVACQQQVSPILIEGTVTEVDHYGQLHPSFTPEDFVAIGVDYGDLLEVSIGEKLVVVTPYVDAYTEAGSMSPCICNYNRSGDFGISMANGSFANHVGGQVGDKLVVRMKKKKGYEKEFNLLQGTYGYDRSKYDSDEIFANFRAMTTTNLKPGVLYRSTSPISFTKNKVRYSYAADLCRQNSIQTIIDIADSDEKIQEFIAAAENKDSYMQECFKNGNIVGLGSNADYIDSVYMRKLAYGLRQMIQKPAPYLIHCNEGKDRTGFYCMLLEALCGATVDEIKEDYMATFLNLYHQKKGTEQYELTWIKNGFRMLYMIVYPETWSNVATVDWSKCSLDGADLMAGANNYILMSGLSQAEIDALKSKVSGEQ